METTEESRMVEDAVNLAAAWQERANQLLTAEEKGIQEQMLRLLTHPMDKVVLTQMIDQSFRSSNTARVADQVNTLLREYGVPDFFSKVEKLMVQMFLSVGRHVSSIAVPRMIEKMRHDSSRAIIPGEAEALHAYLRKRKSQGVTININHLGEAVLGEREALSRLETYLKDLENPEISYISVKISTIYSQIQPLAIDYTVSVLKERLRQLFRAASKNRFVKPDGTAAPKFVNLDMEEYRDLDITVRAFQEILDEPEFMPHSAGIVLQAYLPDSYKIQQSLTEWARKRRAADGSPVKLRIVKGANMEMEMVESAIQNWPLATYDRKLHVDANYKRMVDFGMAPENIEAVHLGIASHNLFELAYADIIAKRNGVTPYFTFEMLEGMADHVRRAICETTDSMVMYAPVADRSQFISAIAYLIRRLDENTAEKNFLRYAPDLNTNSKAWAYLKEQFVASCAVKDRVQDTSNRIQDRNRETFPPETGTYPNNRFINEADTDWSLPPNRKWAESIRDKWKKAPNDAPIAVPVVVAGAEVADGRHERLCFDPSRLPEKVCVATVAMADKSDVEAAVAVARKDPDGWRVLPYRERHRILSAVAMNIRKARGDLIGAAAANTGKVFSEADVEVSEAIDFTEFYPYAANRFFRADGIDCTGKGVSLVISPWNFPIAIPCGGIVASLAAGNTVVFKPASDAVLVAWQLCQCFWDAGISKNTLQFLPCSGSETGPLLTGHEDIDVIILTGGTETGLRILAQRPDIHLAAETGGKNATIVTAMSDRDQAIKNVVYSAFGNCGQKCSATSLLILEKEVYEDPLFKRQLKDAVQSLLTGSAWDFENRMGPLIRPPDTDLMNALTRLEPGESWLLKPENIRGNPHLWTPGIKWDVSQGSYTHMTEFFGPLLGVMCADNLEHAISLVNQTGYGLTSGLESLDKREHDVWKSKIEAGNLYINRGTTGAVVLRQPFGGMKKSALGAGIKAGSPNYVSQFMDIRETGFPLTGPLETRNDMLRLSQEWRGKLRWGQFDGIAEDMRRAVHAMENYCYWMQREFSETKDYFHLRGQDNFFTYRPIGSVMIRLHPDDSLFDVLARIAAAKISGCEVRISIPGSLEDDDITRFITSYEGRKLTRSMPTEFASDDDVIAALPDIQRIRYAAPDRVPTGVLAAAARDGFYVARSTVLMNGRIELLHYFREQSICHTYHRYGNLGDRGLS